MKNIIKRITSIFLLILLFTINQPVLASDANKNIVSGAVAQVNYLLKNNSDNIVKGKSVDNGYVYFLGGNLEDLEFVLNKQNETDFSINYLYQLNEALKNVNKNGTAVYVAFTAYNKELITTIFPDNLSTLTSMENYLRSDVLIKEFGINTDTKDLALSSFQKYSSKFQATYREILQEVYDKSNFKSTDFDNIIIPFTNYSNRQIIQQDGSYIAKKYNLYSLYLPKVNNTFNYENFKKTYRETDVFAPNYGSQRIEQQIERVVLSLDIYFNQGGAVAKPCESLRQNPELQVIIKELEQDPAWKQMIAENPCILNTIYPNLNLYTDSSQFEKDLALFVCAPIYAALAIPAGTIIGEAAFIELGKALIEKYTAKKIKEVSQAIATNIIMQTFMNYYFGDKSITSTKDSSERWLLALKAIDKGDLFKDALIAAYELDLRSDLVLTCLNDGLEIDFENIEQTNFNTNKCALSVLTTIGTKFLFDISSTTVTSVLQRIKADPSIFKNGLRALLNDAGQDGKRAFAETYKEFEEAFEPKGPLIRTVKVEGKYGLDIDDTANYEPTAINKLSFSDNVKDVTYVLEEQINKGVSDINFLGVNIILEFEGYNSINTTLLAETDQGYKLIFVTNDNVTINTLDDFLSFTTTNRKNVLEAIKAGNLNKAKMVGANAEKFFGKTNVPITINSIDIYTLDVNKNITKKEFKLESLVQGAGTALKKVVLGSEDLSQFAINFRKTLAFPNHKGNVAVFEYLDNSGNLVKNAFSTAESGPLKGIHSERIADDFFVTNNIPKSNIKRVYSELEPCELASQCKQLLQTEYKQAEIIYSYGYPGGVDNTIRLNSVNQRFLDLENLLK